MLLLLLVQLMLLLLLFFDADADHAPLVIFVVVGVLVADTVAIVTFDNFVVVFDSVVVVAVAGV